MFENVLRACIIFLSLTIYPYLLNKILRSYYNEKCPSVPAVDRVWVFLNLLAQFLWLLYAMLVSEWILVFTGTFNIQVLIVTLLYDFWQRRVSREFSHIESSEGCPFLLANSLQMAQQGRR